MVEEGSESLQTLKHESLWNHEICAYCPAVESCITTTIKMQVTTRFETITDKVFVAMLRGAILYSRRSFQKEARHNSPTVSRSDGCRV